MDYPQLNLIFGLALLLTMVINIGLRVLLSKVPLPGWRWGLSWVALALSLLAALYIEVLFLRLMTPAFNRQIGIGLLVIAAIGALVTGIFYRRQISLRAAGFLLGAQVLDSLASLVLAFGLYRSLVPA
jgi:hypothetical protein